MQKKFRTFVCTVIALLFAFPLAGAAPADAQEISAEEVNLSAPGGAFGSGWLTPVFGIGSFENDSLIAWGEGTSASPHLRVAGNLASFHVFGGCVEITTRAMSDTAVLYTESSAVCNDAFGIEFRSLAHTFGSPAIRHVEVCLHSDGQKRVCDFASRPDRPVRYIQLTGVFR